MWDLYEELIITGDISDNIVLSSRTEHPDGDQQRTARPIPGMERPVWLVVEEGHGEGNRSGR